ncbi:hypothetical protein [Microbacterium sp.]|uniref:hypothetical protein n=1 Tax=Microbacterium sp. TaxID=51671 RepID=UPI0039E6D3F6
MDELLSRALIQHVGKGRSPFPLSDDDAVRELADADGDTLLAWVRAVETEMMSIEIDWSSRTLSDGGDEAEHILARRHPELSADALNALRWMFTYNWR